MWAARGSAFIALATLVATCGQGQNQGGPPPAPLVTVATPVKRMVTEFDEYVGRFAAINSVEVRARVSGYLDGVHFKDGQLVKQGDLLFTIDKRPFQFTLDQARANLTTAKSNLSYTEADLNRGRELVTQKTITEQIFEQRAQAFRNAQASVNGSQAAVQQAELDLQFTELRAPIDGRIGDRRVSPGNLITGGTTGNTTLLATIVSTDPIYFEFTFDEASLLRYRLAKNGTDVASRGAGVCRGDTLRPDDAHRDTRQRMPNRPAACTRLVTPRGTEIRRVDGHNGGTLGQAITLQRPDAEGFLEGQSDVLGKLLRASDHQPAEPVNDFETLTIHI